MKSTRIAAAVLSGALLCGCADLSPPPKATVSLDYEAAGDTSGIYAFVYGKHTVLALQSRPLRFTIQDENGVTVPYEREGHYYRMTSQLDRFTAWVNLRMLTFNRTSEPTLTVAADVPSTEPIKRMSALSNAGTASASPIVLSAEPTPEQATPSLAQLFTAQLDEVRHAITTQAPDIAEARALTARLDRIETQHARGIATTIRVKFGPDTTNFEPDEQVLRALIPAARAAQAIHIEGHTDARIEGGNDLRIAFGRARAVRQFLIEQGVDGDKISIAARLAGDFVAPAESEEGRTLNRRAEIELVH